MLPVKGNIYRPERKNLIPAKRNGVVYSSPILIPTNAVDHKRHATTARNVVVIINLRKLDGMITNPQKYNKNPGNRCDYRDEI